MAGPTFDTKECHTLGLFSSLIFQALSAIHFLISLYLAVFGQVYAISVQLMCNIGIMSIIILSNHVTYSKCATGIVSVLSGRRFPMAISSTACNIVE